MRLLGLRQLPFLLAVATFAAWFVLLRPTTLGGPTSYLWVSGTSMRPTLDEGDFVVARQADDYVPGDIVAFRIPQGEQGEGGLVIHRIVGGSATEGFVTQGDNKPAPDPWHPTARDVVGALWFAVPGAGPYVRMVREPAVISALAGSLVVFLLMLGRGSGDTTSPRRRPGRFVRLRAPWRRSAAATANPFAAYLWTPARMLSLGAIQAQPGMAVPPVLAAPGQPLNARSRRWGTGPRTGVDDAADPFARYRYRIGPSPVAAPALARPGLAAAAADAPTAAASGKIEASL